METLIDTGRSKLWIYRNYGPDLYAQLDNLRPFLIHNPRIPLGVQHRDIGFFAFPGVRPYAWSGGQSNLIPISQAPVLEEFLPQVNQSLGTNFNGVLLNLYDPALDRDNSIGAHSDDESGLDQNRKMVAGISYGAIRTFRIRNKKTKEIVLDFEWEPCTLVVMEGDFQQEFTHEVPARKRVTTPRISITFRHHTLTK